MMSSKVSFRIAAAGLVLLMIAAAGPSQLQAADQRKEITFDDIKFEMKKEEPFRPRMLTEKIKELEDKRVRIRGYILPASVFRQTGIKQFVLVRDNMECCFGPGAALYDAIIVEMEPGKSASFTTRPVAVDGIFSLKPLEGPDGKYLAIYHLKAREVD